jgi:hypothetical protein
LVTVLAATVQGAIGFAFTLVALPLFLLVLESTEAIQILLVLNLVVPLCLVRHLWRDAPTDLARLLIMGAVLGLPLGMVMFAYASLDTVKVVVGALVLAFAGVLALRPSSLAAEPSTSTPEPPTGSAVPSEDASNPRSANSQTPRYRKPSVLLVGVAAGAMTSALSMPGPVLVLYMTGIGLSKTAFRALSLSLSVFLYSAALVLQAATVGVPPRVWITVATLVPLAWVGGLAGHALAGRIGETTFLRLVLLLLLATGLYTLITTLNA